MLYLLLSGPIVIWCLTYVTRMTYKFIPLSTGLIYIQESILAIIVPAVHG